MGRWEDAQSILLLSIWIRCLGSGQQKPHGQCGSLSPSLSAGWPVPLTVDDLSFMDFCCVCAVWGLYQKTPSPLLFLTFPRFVVFLCPMLTVRPYVRLPSLWASAACTNPGPVSD